MDILSRIRRRQAVALDGIRIEMHGQRIANADKSRNNVKRILALIFRDDAEIPQASFRGAADSGIVCDGCVAVVLDISDHALPDLGRLGIRL